MSASERKLRQELATLTETVEALREEIALLRGAVGSHQCVHTYVPLPPTPPQSTHVIPWAQPYTAPQVICGDPPGTVTSGSSMVTYPGTITIN